ncbi:SDR family NAD(P)-dependent oxidoreductase [Kitasatospora phosalacinea]|uniref:Short-chain dehydrogenase n=1 Tax=Kitasatospora phosalacinea TaxID=2065 RepID=A0A9W6PH93_9ACTN|nr:SDR family oxidoreductase [Kitasatospora phosalacinea]GLW55000.1 short-chain dehydrogenase [Kitasatospora phosalacinea]
MTNGELHGLTALVTGGASGIGLATALMLAGRGARVACLDLNALDADGKPAVPEPLIGIRGDVSDDASTLAAVTEAAERLGGLDILVNNAGVLGRGTVESGDLDEWKRVFDVNVFGMVRTARAALPWLRRSAHASVVNMCSLGATVGLPNAAVYCSSKGAVLALTTAMAADHLHEGIRVNCVTPAPVDTPWVRRLVDAAPDPDAAFAAVSGRQPNGRLCTAEEVAAAICYLAGPASASTTGVSLPVDGGTRGVLLSMDPRLLPARAKV